MYQIEVQYFAAARDLAGCTHERVSLPASEIGLSALRDLLASAHPRLLPYLPRMRLAINEELASPSIVRAGDVVAVLPPVAGGAGPQPPGAEPDVAHAGLGPEDSICEIRETAISVDDAIAAVAHPAAGGVCVFLGLVRDHAQQRAVERLDYEAHARMAVAEMRRIGVELKRSHPGTRLCALHRVGTLGVGEVAVVVAASAAHRGDAFAVCREAIDAIKERVPIWKREWFADGDATWVNLEG